ncbi:MAG: hypothetical protein ACOCSM_01805, partial [Bacillota bacterium]
MEAPIGADLTWIKTIITESQPYIERSDSMALRPSTKKTLLEMQKSELTEYYIYHGIAKRIK